ncbi:MAG: hypothetical protein COT74_08550 [Bdellovibrionales bacterium CG10_big_fil_rev_8_21_14_0_10_45_34]|nr:MAG: hypothetical protein COT74_08550 [Bdellovibrionales bacterium CG10_big_fil_rev_8_21_14_0_10_45_34]
MKSEVNGLAVETILTFDRIERKDTKLFLSRNGKSVEVKITSDGFANNHFENPRYSVTYEGGTFEYSLKGHACWAYSVNLALLMIGAYTH